MLRTLIVTVATFALLSGVTCFKFQITKELETAKELTRESWIYVEVNETNLPEDIVTVKINIPLSLEFTDVFVFFANESKKILQVSLKKVLEGKFFAVPYRVEKEISGQNTKISVKEKFTEISGVFPREWLPKNCTKINAAVLNSTGHIYNCYEIRNFKISIPDLLLVEEYEKYFPSAQVY